MTLFVRETHSRWFGGRALATALLLTTACWISFGPRTAHADFSDPSVVELGGDVAPYAEFVDDLNADGADDMILSVENKVMVLLGSSDGSLTKELSLTFIYPITGITTGDFDGDGAVDLALQAYFGRVLLYYNPSTVPFSLEAAGTFEAATSDVFQTTDYDGDGTDDLVIGRDVYLNDGSGNFVLSAVLPSEAVTGDVNGDGLGDSVEPRGDILCGRLDGTFELCSQVTINGGLFATAALNDAAGLEVLSWDVAAYTQDPVTYTINHCGTGRTYRKLSGTSYVIRGDEYRRTTGCVWTTTIMETVISSSALVVNTVAQDGTVSIWRGGEIPGVMSDLQLADFDADGFQDVLATNSDGEGFLYLGLGDGTFGTPASIGVMNGPAPLIIGDYNGDGAADIAWTETAFQVDTLLYYALGASGTDATVVETVTTTVVSGETIEIFGTITEVGDSYIGVDGVSVYYDADSVIKFEDDTSGTFETGLPVEGEGLQDADGTVYAVKIQVGG